MPLMNPSNAPRIDEPSRSKSMRMGSDYPAVRWWQDEHGLLFVIDEYLKLGFYMTHY